VNSLAKLVKLEWIRPLMYNLGGRKVVVAGGGMAVIKTIVDGGPMDWPRAVACLSVAVVAAVTAIAVSMDPKAAEDKKEELVEVKP
jgi:hypothetical protein